MKKDISGNGVSKGLQIFQEEARLTNAPAKIFYQIKNPTNEKFKAVVPFLPKYLQLHSPLDQVVIDKSSFTQLFANCDQNKNTWAKLYARPNIM